VCLFVATPAYIPTHHRTTRCVHVSMCACLRVCVSVCLFVCALAFIPTHHRTTHCLHVCMFACLCVCLCPPFSYIPTHHNTARKPLTCIQTDRLTRTCACILTQHRTTQTTDMFTHKKDRHATLHASQHNTAPHEPLTGSNTYNPVHCNTLQNTATHCSTLQHTATHCNTHKPLTGASTYNPFRSPDTAGGGGGVWWL